MKGREGGGVREVGGKRSERKGRGKVRGEGG